jgi:hypothetical protein
MSRDSLENEGQILSRGPIRNPFIHPSGRCSPRRKFDAIGNLRRVKHAFAHPANARSEFFLPEADSETSWAVSIGGPAKTEFGEAPPIGARGAPSRDVPKMTFRDPGRSRLRPSRVAAGSPGGSPSRSRASRFKTFHARVALILHTSPNRKRVDDFWGFTRLRFGLVGFRFEIETVRKPGVKRGRHSFRTSSV